MKALHLCFVVNIRISIIRASNPIYGKQFNNLSRKEISTIEEEKNASWYRVRFINICEITLFFYLFFLEKCDLH